MSVNTLSTTRSRSTLHSVSLVVEVGTFIVSEFLNSLAKTYLHILFLVFLKRPNNIGRTPLWIYLGKKIVQLKTNAQFQRLIDSSVIRVTQRVIRGWVAYGDR